MAVARPGPPDPSAVAGPDPATELARRWADQLPAAGRPTVAQLRTLLRRMSAMLHAEQFWAPAARRLGASLYERGPGARPVGAGGPLPEDLLPPTLRLLRAEAQPMIGSPGARCAERLAAVLDQLVAGYVGALRDRADSDRQDLLAAAAWPADEMQRVLADGDLHYRTLYLQGPVAIAVADLDGDVVDMNPALHRMFGLRRAPQLPRAIADFVHPDDVATFVQAYHRLCAADGPDTGVIDTRLVRPDEIVLWTRISGSLVRDEHGAPSRIIAVVQDLSERQQLRSRLEQAATRDRLTQLPNRAVTEQRLRAAFASGVPRVGLCAVDIDGFRAVNETLGHQAGDQLLAAVAGRLEMAAGEHEVSRTGGDEFAVLAVGTSGLADVCRLADRLLAALSMPLQIGGRLLTVTASVGVAEAATTSTVPEELMRSADVAMSWAKSRGGGRRVVFDPERDAGEAARFALLAGLPDAVANDEMRLAFQPLVGLADRRLRGAEALVRWQHPEEGLIGPGRFIELAERSGAIVSLGAWVLREACRVAAGWHAELGDDSPYVSVNVSPSQLIEASWVDDVTDVLAETGLPPRKLQLEITEQAVLGDEAITLDALGVLRDAGVRLALDDFGTGYSSLAWLRMLPVHALKIDGSFIDGLRHPDPDPMDQSIVRALVEMAHALGLEVTAEWVETGVQAARLASLGCDVGQGRWFGDAGPAGWVQRLARRTIG